MKLYLVKKQSKKEGKATYVVLYADLGYQKVYINFNADDIAKLLNVSAQSLFDRDYDKPEVVATLKVGA